MRGHQLCAMWEFTSSPSVVVGVKDHSVHNLLANWTRWQVGGPGSRHGLRTCANNQGVCKCGAAQDESVHLFASKNEAELTSE